MSNTETDTAAAAGHQLNCDHPNRSAEASGEASASPPAAPAVEKSAGRSRSGHGSSRRTRQPKTPKPVVIPLAPVREGAEVSEEYLRTFTTEEIGVLPLTAFVGKIIFVECDRQLHQAMKVLLDEELLGFDTETRPIFRKGAIPPPALLQLCVVSNVFGYSSAQASVTPSMKVKVAIYYYQVSWPCVDGDNGVQQAGFYSNALNCLHLLLCKGQARGMLDCRGGGWGAAVEAQSAGTWKGSLPFITRRRCSCTTNPGLDCKQAQAHCWEATAAAGPASQLCPSFITHLRLPC